MTVMPGTEARAKGGVGAVHPRPAPDGAPTIEVYADIWCPFAHVGLRAVVARRALAGREDVAIRVRAWPLELVNAAPLDPAVTEAHVEELRTQVAPDLFGHFDVTTFPTSTLEALALVHRAYRVDLSTGERMSLALRDALFEEGRDIGAPATVAQLAGALSVGLPDDRDRDGVLAEWDEGGRRGVRGSPHFFCGGRDLFCPALDIERDPSGELSVTRNTERLATFLEGCLAPAPEYPRG
jgi:predicted DsbA family dithiol-disulfide isomerase